MGGREGRGEGREERRGGKRKGKDAVGGPGRQWAYGKTPAADEDLQVLARFVLLSKRDRERI